MGSSKKSSDRDKEKEKEVRKKRKDRSRERVKRRSKSRERGRDRSKERGRDHDRSRSRERGRDRSRSKERGRDRSKERGRDRDRSRSRERGRDRSRSREKERKRDRSKSKERRRDRSKSRERGRDRSRSRERGKSRERDRDRSRSRDRKRSSQKERERESNHRKESDLTEEEGERRRNGKRSIDASSRGEKGEDRQGEEPVTVKASSTGDVVTLSIEETNKLRISLGLKPLQVDGDTTENKEKSTEEAPVATKKDAIHAPPKNIGQLKASEQLKEKIATRKEARKITDALSSVRRLGEVEGEGEDEDSSSWVTRMRKLQEEKKKAEEKARLLAEMDEEFGIGDIISEVEKEERSKAYGSHDLKGIKVEHDVAAFKEGRNVMLVMKDRGVLDESEDTLLNPNLVEVEKASKNVEMKKGKPGYNPYEDEEVDEFGNVKRKELLNKYDEEIYGEKKKMFSLGEGGTMDTSAEREKEIIRQRLLDKQVTLEMAPARVASEYYTPEEMVQFKKPKKRRKVRKGGTVKADDLIPLGKEDTSKDHGSRSQRHEKEEDMEIDVPMATIAATGEDDLKDEADSSVDIALMRTRRLLNRRKATGEKMGAAKVVTMIQNTGGKMEEEMKKDETRLGDGDTIILDTTAEFCRQVGENEDKRDVRRSSSGHQDDSYGEDQEMRDEDMDVIEEDGGWTEVKETTERKASPGADDLYQEAEPLVASGVVATLQLAARKGFVNTKKAAAKKDKNVFEAPSTARRDVEYERQKEKERDRELSRYGREGSFPEKKDYTPDIKIEYVDDKGRLLDTKEAFRFMSHKFHGRGSGRKKMEKRLKKIKEERLLQSTSSTDTPLNTLAVLQSKQKAAQSAYILVSGGAQSLLAPDIAKRK